jgi:4'-phosphopantetheinyl transferase
MSATDGKSAASNETVSSGEGVVIERRSPHRPKFSKGWRKTIEAQSAEVAVAPVTGAIDTIDIWVAHPESLLRAHSCLKLLTDDDWFGLQDIQSAAIRQSATAARILLRLGLSRTVDRGVAPSVWTFERDGNGKPSVSKAHPQIHFSVAHVDELSVVAVSKHLEVGVDVESVDQDVNAGVIEQFSHPDEHNAVRDLLPRQRVREFLRFWTLKEAYTKMAGVGHSLDFDTVRFVLDPLALKSVADQPKAMPPQFESFYVPLGHELYHVSLAIEHPEQRASVTEVQIIGLVKPKALGATTHAPGRN